MTTRRKSQRPQRASRKERAGCVLLAAAIQALTDIQTARRHALQADVAETTRKRIEYTLAPSVHALQYAIARAERRRIQPKREWESEQPRTSAPDRLRGDALPEGLFLNRTDRLSISPRSGDIVIADAAGLPWVVFTTGGHGDPSDWLRTIIRRTCDALGVTDAVYGTRPMTIDAFITRLLKATGHTDGFAP